MKPLSYKIYIQVMAYVMKQVKFNDFYPVEYTIWSEIWYLPNYDIISQIRDL